MTLLVIGMMVFYAVHFTRMVAPGFRQAMLTRMGEGPWKGIYALISLLGIVLIVMGWMQFRPEAPDVYRPAEWGRHVAALLVLIGFILNFSAYREGGRIKAVVQHPMLLGIIFWATGHLFANGDLASLILFGSFIIYSVIAIFAAISRREPRAEFVSYRGDMLAIVIGVVVYLVFALWLHGLLFGVSPF